MKYVVLCITHLLMCCSSMAATPIDGLYSGFFGSYVYTPANVNYPSGSALLNSPRYQGGFDAGGNIGYKSNPMRYEGEVFYLKTNIDHFYLNDTVQTGFSGYDDALFAMANIYYDVPTMNPILQPYVGAGIGYGWVQAHLLATGPTVITTFNAENSTFAYQATAGVTFNFAENYALNMGYKYLGTSSLSQFGDIFQAHIATVGATYRFDGSNYK